MGYVRFKGNPEVFQMRIEAIGSNRVRLYPPFPDTGLAGFELLTRPKGGKVYGNYLSYATLYRKMEDGSIVLSNDGSVYVPPIPPEPPVYKVIFVIDNGRIIGESEQTPGSFEKLVVPEVATHENYEFLGWNPEIPQKGKLEKDYVFYALTRYVPTLDEVKVQKKAEISEACENTIHSGIDVKIGEEWEHFSLQTNDQINLFGKQYQLANGATSVEYHQDGHPCKYYSAEDMMKIITAAMEWVSYHTTYCNALNMWIAGAESKDEVNTIYYGADVPEEYQSEVLKDYLAKIASEAEVVTNETETAS